MTEALTVELARINAVSTVINRASVDALGENLTVSQIFEQLGADVIVDTKMHEAPRNEVRVSVSLLEAPFGTTIWTETFTGTTTESGILVATIARAIQGQLAEHLRAR